MCTLCKTSNSLYTVLNKRGKLKLNRYNFLVPNFCVENLSQRIFFYSGVNLCGNFYLHELIFVDSWKNYKNRKKWNPQKSCATQQSKKMQHVCEARSLDMIIYSLLSGGRGDCNPKSNVHVRYMQKSTLILPSVSFDPLFFSENLFLTQQTFMHPKTLFYRIWLNTVSKGT